MQKEREREYVLSEEQGENQNHIEEGQRGRGLKDQGRVGVKFAMPDWCFVPVIIIWECGGLVVSAWRWWTWVTSFESHW